MLAHQGGWDEMLYVLVPIAFIAFLLRTANKRARTMQASRGEAASDEPG